MGEIISSFMYKYSTIIIGNILFVTQMFPILPWFTLSLIISMAMEMDNIELMVELQVFTHIHDQRAVHRQFIPDTQ